MEFKWLRTLKWGENRLANEFPMDSCRNQNNGFSGKRREWNGDCRSWTYFWVVQQWIPLEGIRKLGKSPSDFKVGDLNTRGHGQITRGESSKDILPHSESFWCSLGLTSIFPLLPRSILYPPPLCSMHHVDCITKCISLSCPRSSRWLHPMGDSGRKLRARRMWGCGIYFPSLIPARSTWLAK